MKSIISKEKMYGGQPGNFVNGGWYPQTTTIPFPLDYSHLFMAYGQGTTVKVENETDFSMPPFAQTAPTFSLQLPIKTEVKQEALSLKDEPKIEPKVERKKAIERPRKKKGKKTQIKPERSAMTNIGNQILTFLYIEKKSGPTLLRMFPDISNEDLSKYYHFTKKLKECTYGYFNKSKLEKLWRKEGNSLQENINFQIIRKLSYFYLNNLIIPALLTSRKMPNKVKPLHMHIRRKMLNFLIGKDDLTDL